jgi:hypothetical protein
MEGIMVKNECDKFPRRTVFLKIYLAVSTLFIVPLAELDAVFSFSCFIYLFFSSTFPTVATRRTMLSQATRRFSSVVSLFVPCRRFDSVENVRTAV